MLFATQTRQETRMTYVAVGMAFFWAKTWFHGVLKSKIVSHSSTEAEYRLLALATAELYWICMLLH